MGLTFCQECVSKFMSHISRLLTLFWDKRHFSLVARLNGDVAGSIDLDIFNLDDTWLYRTSTAELEILIEAARNYVKNQIRPACFHAPTF